MKPLTSIEEFGGIDADSDTILLDCFEDHEAFKAVLARKRFLVLGRKGSGKTSIFKKILTIETPKFFSFGHTFTDYPWHHHDKQARLGVPETDRFTHSWKYLLLMTFSKMVLNHDQSIPFNDASMEAVSNIERFVVDSYGTRDPDVTQVFSPTKRLKLRPTFQLDWKILKFGISPDSLPVAELPTIVQEVNSNLQNLVLTALNSQNEYHVCFDQLDLGFSLTDANYSNRLIGLLLACRDFNLAAQTAKKAAHVSVFLRDDIYEELHFEDKNKITQPFATTIEWDTSRTKNTLKSMMEKRFNKLLAQDESEDIKWEHVFEEGAEMPGRQKKYSHIIDRTFLRPRDIIKLCNEILVQYDARVRAESLNSAAEKIQNSDIHLAREEYSQYFLKELDDELHKHIPKYADYFEVFKAIGALQFTLQDFSAAYQMKKRDGWAEDPLVILKEFFAFSIIGCYRAGGRGYGGSEYTFRYREPRAQFDETALRFRIHPGLLEVLGLKKFSKSPDAIE